jgi:hypothetical protein
MPRSSPVVFLYGVEGESVCGRNAVNAKERGDREGQVAADAVEGVSMGVEGLFGSVVEEQETQERVVSAYISKFGKPRFAQTGLPRR